MEKGYKKSAMELIRQYNGREEYELKQIPWTHIPWLKKSLNVLIDMYIDHVGFHNSGFFLSKKWDKWNKHYNYEIFFVCMHFEDSDVKTLQGISWFLLECEREFTGHGGHTEGGIQLLDNNAEHIMLNFYVDYADIKDIIRKKKRKKHAQD